MRIKKPVEVIHGSYDTIRVPKGEIRSDRPDGTAVWQKIDGALYVTCMGCNAINAIDDDFLITFDGDISPCVICNNCLNHNFYKLSDWDGSGTYRCEKCARVETLTRKEFDKKGWTQKKATCECCTSAFCQRCKNSS